MNPQHPVLETGTLPIELLAYPKLLLNFPVNRMLPLGRAVLLQLYSFRAKLLVFGGTIIPPLAFRACQLNEFARHDFLAFEPSGPDPKTDPDRRLRP